MRARECAAAGCIGLTHRSGVPASQAFPHAGNWQVKLMLSNPSLRTRTGYDIAVRYATPLWRIGAEFRAACVAGLWVLLAWFPAHELPRAAAQLLMVSVGVSMAWVVSQPGLLDRLASAPIPPVRE